MLIARDKIAEIINRYMEKRDILYHKPQGLVTV